MEGMSARSLRALEEHEGASGGVYVAAKDTPSNDVLRDKPGIVAEKAEWSSQQHRLDAGDRDYADLSDGFEKGEHSSIAWGKQDLSSARGPSTGRIVERFLSSAMSSDLFVVLIRCFSC